MVPRLVPEISSLDAFCDGAGAGAGIGDSRSWMRLSYAILLAGSLYHSYYQTSLHPKYERLCLRALGPKGWEGVFSLPETQHRKWTESRIIHTKRQDHPSTSQYYISLLSGL